MKNSPVGCVVLVTMWFPKVLSSRFYRFFFTTRLQIIQEIDFDGAVVNETRLLHAC